MQSSTKKNGVCIFIFSRILVDYVLLEIDYGRFAVTLTQILLANFYATNIWRLWTYVPNSICFLIPLLNFSTSSNKVVVIMYFFNETYTTKNLFWNFLRVANHFRNHWLISEKGGFCPKLQIQEQNSPFSRMEWFQKQIFVVDETLSQRIPFWPGVLMNNSNIVCKIQLV